MMSFFTDEGLDINGFLLTPETSTDDIKSLGSRITVEETLDDRDKTHILFNEQMFDNGMRFRVEVFKFKSIEPDYIKIVPFKINEEETGEQLYERCRMWLESIFSKSIPDNEFGTINFSVGDFITCLWKQTRENGTTKCRSVRIYKRSVV
jgi:hypothetical protein